MTRESENKECNKKMDIIRAGKFAGVQRNGKHWSAKADGKVGAVLPLGFHAEPSDGVFPRSISVTTETR